MKISICRSTLNYLAPIVLGLVALSCGSGGGGGGSNGGSSGGFQVNSVNLAPNSVWAINRPITITFNEPVNFNTVNLNSINIRQLGGTPAIGEFILDNPTTVSFQPLCPRLPDFSDAGLQPGGVEYELNILGGSAFSVRSTSGSILTTSDQRFFTTPNSTDPAALFFDTVPGSPVPVVRSAGSVATDASYIEIGGDPSNRVYFERAANGVVTLQNGFLLPHNLLSNSATDVAFLISFNQPVDPSASNIDPARLRIEYLDQAGTWQPLTSLLTLETNCVGTGSRVRIQPQGALPSDSELRGFISPEFRDLVGETNSITQTQFAPATTSPATATQGDSLEEEFTIGGTNPGSHEDTNAPLGLPFAEWGDGKLATAFGFTGTGGTGGDFDWQVAQGQVFVLDTTTLTIFGGPNFSQQTQQVVVGGVLDLHNFRVNQGGVLRVQGPNPVTILASGFVQIDGLIEVSGTDSKGVSTLNTTHLPEPGAPGVAGGGQGGTGSPLTNASSPSATPGQGAFGQPGGGGKGGQATFFTGGGANLTARRGTGGGGGRLGPDQVGAAPPLFDQTIIGLDAEPGFPNTYTGNPNPIGAVSGTTPPLGGDVGPSPFIDANSGNDFFGAKFASNTSTVTIGELNRPWAGAGGGGGGDACYSNGAPFPVVPFDPGGDEKGAGGGGGGGSIQILALGRITFGATGSLKCRGGTGGGGENTINLDRVGGGSGAGSGGHVILQSAAKIDFSAVTTLTQVSITATGGQGGAGANNTGGAQIGLGGSQETPPSLDACPVPQTGCAGVISGAGGDGSPGIIQLHTPGGLAGGDILLPPSHTLADHCKPKPVAASATERLIPTFGRASVARSLWIPMGLGGFDPSAVVAPFFKPSTFDFGNVDTLTGEVQTTAGVVNLGPALLGPASIAVAPNLPFITSSGRTLIMDASSLIGSPQEYFLQNTGLLKRATIRLSQVGSPNNNLRFDVVTAVYSSTSIPPTLQLTVASTDPLLTSFSAPGGVDAELIPTFFKISTTGVADSLPASAAIAIKFQAAPATLGGIPNVAAAVPAVPGSDVSVLNASPINRDFRFLRFQVEFDIDKLNQGISPTTPLPVLDFLRLPFRY